jgi:transposase-like protein
MPNDSTQSGTRRAGAGARSPLAEGPRQRYLLDFKLQVVKETLVPGASVSVVARRHGMNTNVVFRWRKQFREGRLGNGRLLADKGLPTAGFVPIHVAEDVAPMRALPAPREPGGENVKAAGPAADAKTPGLIEIETAGGVKLRLSGRVDDRALRRVLAAIRRLT